MSPYLSESYIIFINVELLLKSYWSQKLHVSRNRTLKWVEIFKKENTGHMLWSILVGSLIECAFYLVNPDLQKNKHARIYQKGNVFKYYQLYKLTRKFFREILAGAFVLGFCEMATNKKILDYVIYPYGFSDFINIFAFSENIGDRHLENLHSSLRWFRIVSAKFPSRRFFNAMIIFFRSRRFYSNLETF